MEEMTIYDILQQTSDLFLMGVCDEDRAIAMQVIKKYRWFFLSKWPRINNTKIMVGEYEEV